MSEREHSKSASAFDVWAGAQKAQGDLDRLIKREREEHRLRKVEMVTLIRVVTLEGVGIPPSAYREVVTYIDPDTGATIARQDPFPT